jgi:stage V sporulation protein G
MEITKVEIVPCEKGRLRAYVNITVDHCLLISDLKLIRSKKGYLVAMPAKRRSDVGIMTLSIDQSLPYTAQKW